MNRIRITRLWKFNSVGGVEGAGHRVEVYTKDGEVLFAHHADENVNVGPIELWAVCRTKYECVDVLNAWERPGDAAEKTAAALGLPTPPAEVPVEYGEDEMPALAD